MNTAPNRRASDNASSPPGTSPTRRFSDMLKESSGSDGDGILVIGIDRSGDGPDTILTLTKTYREIKNAAFAIIVGEGLDVETGVSDVFSRNTVIVHSLTEYDGLYTVNDGYVTDNIDGYPSQQGGK